MKAEEAAAAGLALGEGECEGDEGVGVLAPCPPVKMRPTMISAKYRLKEERRKVLKMSIAKLRKIEDPESCLRRSVLVNNTMKRLQREAREEKLSKQQQQQLLLPHRQAPAPAPAPAPAAGKENARPASSRKRPLDDVDDCDVQDVLSQFYMPPTPRMLTSIDDDPEELSSSSSSSGVGAEGEVDAGMDAPSPAKRPRPSPAPAPRQTDDPTAAADDDDDPLAMLSSEDLADPQDVDMTLALHAAGLTTRVGGEAAAPAPAPATERPFWAPTPASVPSSAGSSGSDPIGADPHFSCGHSSIFGEIQSVVYHSLIASLES